MSASIGILLASLMPEEKILEDLKEALTQYEITKTKEAKDKVKMFVVLAATKFATEGKDVVEVMKDFEDKSTLLKNFGNKG